MTNKVEKGKLLTPIAQSPLNKNGVQGPFSKSKSGVFSMISPSHNIIKDDAGVYYPGMLKKSPNSGFTEFKRPQNVGNEENFKIPEPNSQNVEEKKD